MTSLLSSIFYKYIVLTYMDPNVQTINTRNTRKNNTRNTRKNNTRNTRKNNTRNTLKNNKSKIRFSRNVFNLQVNKVNSKKDLVIQCVVCENTAFKVKSTKFPTGSKARQWFFGNLGEIFEDQANVLICQNCGYCMWFTQNAPLR